MNRPKIVRNRKRIYEEVEPGQETAVAETAENSIQPAPVEPPETDPPAAEEPEVTPEQCAVPEEMAAKEELKKDEVINEEVIAVAAADKEDVPAAEPEMEKDQEKETDGAKKEAAAETYFEDDDDEDFDIDAEVKTASDGAEDFNEEDDEKYPEAIRIVHTWSAWGAGAGLVPLPLLDGVGLIAAQLRMLKLLADLYEVPFDTQRSKTAIAVLVSGANTFYLAGSSAKLVPFLGVLSMATMPAINGAITYAVGRVFIRHFASGGTLLDFDPTSVKNYFAEHFQRGKQQ